MILQQALTLARQKLGSQTDIEDALLESEVLLREVVQLDRIRLRLQGDRRLSAEQESRFNALLERRIAGEPLAYILQRREFFALDFYVDRRVLIPRPESELLVEETLKLARDLPDPLIADVGTGSGAIAVSLAVNLPRALILASDISAPALEVARLNGEKHGVSERIALYEGDLLQALPRAVDILVSNLPYVATADLDRMPSRRYEPHLALDGGVSGLDYYPRLCAQLGGKLRPGGIVLLEVGLGQSRSVAGWLLQAEPGGQIDFRPDLAGIERVVILKLPSRSA